ncbi:MAG: cysteine synthase family protein [Candidatus Aenigmarchaeota archaeon]|nr:cysteine synthase family protein [Candidatus Aenigmarchaeota archaeon]
MSILNCIGNTPMVEIEGIKIKLEHLNPSGSVKDRIAKYIVEKAEKTGLLKKGYTIVEATSGNTGIAFSFVAAVKGYKMVAVMPQGMSREREQIMSGYGAKVLFSERGCVKCAVGIAEKLAKTPRHYMPRQFENKWNIEEHEIGMGKEILEQTGKVDCFVAGVGTGGTLIGVGKALMRENLNVQLVAVEPDECALLSGKGYGKHKIFGLHKGFTCADHRIEGIGDGFIPKIVEDNRKLIDDVIAIKSSEALEYSKKLAKLGYFVGPSSGANFLAALRLKKKYKNIVTLFPDRGDRYLSENIFG